jgi:hypothetical protein
MTTIVLGYGRLPTDPPSGNAWSEVWINYAQDTAPVEIFQLGWKTSHAEMAIAYADWINSRADLSNSMVLIAGGNFRALRQFINETYNTEKENTK